MEIFYAPDIDGTLVHLDAGESGHCVKVLRHREGDAVDVIDGRGTLYHCRLTDADPRGATAVVESSEPGFGAHPYRLTMAVCPTKNLDRFEWFAEKATEVVVDVIAPVIGDHSERKVLKTDRVKRLVLSAAKQSLKGLVPEVPEPVSVREFLASAPADAVRMICYCFESPDAPRRSVQDVLGELGADGSADCPEIRILIGPEGDFSPEEVQLALSLGWKPVHLGASRLRTETAALVAATSVYLSAISA